MVNKLEFSKFSKRIQSFSSSEKLLKNNKNAFLNKLNSLHTDYRSFAFNFLLHIVFNLYFFDASEVLHSNNS